MRDESEPVADTGGDTDKLVEDSDDGTDRDTAGMPELPDTGGDTGGAGSTSPLGRTWRLDLSSAEVTEPASIGMILAAYVEDYLLVEVVAADSSTLAFRWGWTQGFTSRQDTCAPTTDTTASAYAAPAFATGPTDAPIWGLQEMAGEDAWIAGTLSADGAVLEDATFSALGDTRTLSSLLGSSDPDAFCDLLRGMGERCEPCADGSPTCMRVTFAHMTGHDLSPLPLTEVARPCP